MKAVIAALASLAGVAGAMWALVRQEDRMIARCEADRIARRSPP